MKRLVKKNNKGFTLAELLIVVAIIAVLVAISIPIFTSQLEKSREATDMANIRAAYSEIAASALTDPDNSQSATIEKKQTQDGWQTTGTTEIAGVALENINSTDTTTVVYTAGSDGSGVITIDGTEVTSSFVDSSESGN